MSDLFINYVNTTLIEKLVVFVARQRVEIKNNHIIHILPGTTYILLRKQFHKYRKVRPQIAEEERSFLLRLSTTCNEKRTRKVFARDFTA